MNKQFFTQASLMAAAMAVVFVVIITIAGELYKVTVDGTVTKPIKDMLANLHGHHWVGKGVWAIILYVVSLGIMYRLELKDDSHEPLDVYINILSYVLIMGTILLFGFFTYEYLIHH